MNRATLLIAICLIVSLFGNGLLYQKYDRQKDIIVLIDQKDKLQQQQMNDITMVMFQKTNENVTDVARQTGKIEGMLAVMSNLKPDANESSQIWHQGYYRGLDQAKDMKAILSPLQNSDTVEVTDQKK